MTLSLQSHDLWKNRPFVPDKAFASLTLVTTFLSWLESKGFDPDKLLRNTGIKRSTLADLGTQIAYPEYRTFLSNALEQWGSEDLGLEYGKDLHFTSFGVIGHAALTAPTLRDAAKIFTKYFVLKVRYINLKVSYENDILKHTYFSPVPDLFLRRFHMDSALASTQKLYLGLDPAVKFTTARLSYSHDNIRKAYRSVFTGELEFDTDETSIAFHGANLDNPSPFANPVSSQLGLRYCELEYETQKRSGFIQEGGRLELIGKVQAMISENLSDPPSTSEVAKTLAMSERSLRRAIADYNLSYRQILSDTRAKYAAQKLISSDEQISTIAQDLGYENAANFSRAFKKWYDESPLTFRRKRRIKRP